ncbi:MAG: hypothetical protein JRF62_16685 [Deltaproteobacteria bacterium]|nr:hypothetical protein [Deltaproteobacteria bacterium]
MPIYEYECKDCSHCFEVLLLFSSDPPPQCPECQCNSSDPPPQCPECQCKDVARLMSSSTMRKQEEYTGAGGMLDPLVGPSF